MQVIKVFLLGEDNSKRLLVLNNGLVGLADSCLINIGEPLPSLALRLNALALPEGCTQHCALQVGG